MLFYLFVFLTVALIYRVSPKYACFLIVAIMLVLAFFRSTKVGSDYEGYITLIESGYYGIDLLSAFNWYRGGDYSDTTFGAGAFREFGFSLIISALSLIFSAKTIIFLLISLIYICYIIALKKVLINWEFVSLAIFILFLIYILYAPYNTLRQSLAISIFTLGSVYYISDAKIKGIILLLLASTIHFTAILTGVFVILSKWIKINPKICRIIFGVCLIVYLFNLNLDFFTKLLPDDFAGRDVGRGLDERFEVYNVYVHILNFILMLFGVYIFNLFYIKSNSSERPYFMLWFFGLVLYILLIQSPNVGRISEYFYIFLSIATVLVLKRLRNKKSKKMLLDNLIIYCFLWQFLYILYNWYGIQPYMLS